MNTHSENYMEYPQTAMNFARIRITLEHPDWPQSYTTAMHIPPNFIDDFELEVEAKKRLRINSRNRVPEDILRYSVHELHEAEKRARESRQLLSHLVTRSLSDSFAKEVTR